jgi:hypothetical protein
MFQKYTHVPSPEAAPACPLIRPDDPYRLPPRGNQGQTLVRKAHCARCICT